MIQYQVNHAIEADVDDHGQGHGHEAAGPRWLTELRPLDVCLLAGALGFVAYRFLCA